MAAPSSTRDYSAAERRILVPHPPGYRLRRGRNWFFLGLTYASYYLCRQNLGIIAPELKAALGLSNAQYGAIQTARNGAYAIGQFINGLFTDRLGGKQAMTLGAAGTVVLNLFFGITAWSNIGWLFFALLLIRLADGYVQAFGSPGMVKINTAWFRRRERGGFAGIFGGMIQLGAVGVGQLGGVLATGLAVPLIFFTLTVPKLDWRYMFIVPPVITAIIIVLMNLMVKNHPEEAGYRIVHDEEASDDDPHERLHMGEVFRVITGNPVVWIVAGAYFCTGFVRAAIVDWWPMYLNEVWAIERGAHPIYKLLVWAIPITAFLGSFASGMISDKVFRGRRAPVATALYFGQTLFTLAAIALARSSVVAGVVGMAALLIGINTACNATHSILGTAAAMDLGGRKMAGFSSGVIDSFQYFGQMLAGFGLGKVIDLYRLTAPGQKLAAVSAGAACGPRCDLFNSTVWFSSMLPWGLLGTGLMAYLWLRHRGSDVAGT